MKTTVQNLTSPEFYAKHAGLRPASAFGLLIAQVVSGLSAYYGILAVVGSNWIGQVTGVLIALLCEIVVRVYGSQWFVSRVEKRHGVKAYYIEEDRARLSDGLDRTKLVVFALAAVTTSAFTLLGGYLFLFGRVHIEDRKEIASVMSSELTDAERRTGDVTAPLRTLAQRLEKDVAAAERNVAQMDRNARNAMQEYGATRRWTAATSEANKWLNKGGRDRALQALQAQKDRLSSTLEEIAATAKEETVAARRNAETIVAQNAETRGEQLRNAARNGSFGFVAGLAAQVLAFYLLWVLACIDVGAGTVKKYTRHHLDGRDLLAERWRIWVNRWRIRYAYANARLAEKPIVYKGRELDTKQVEAFIGIEHLEDDGVAPKKEARVIGFRRRNESATDTEAPATQDEMAAKTPPPAGENPVSNGAQRISPEDALLVAEELEKARARLRAYRSKLSRGEGNAATNQRGVARWESTVAELETRLQEIQ